MKEIRKKCTDGNEDEEQMHDIDSRCQAAGKRSESKDAPDNTSYTVHTILHIVVSKSPFDAVLEYAAEILIYHEPKIQNYLASYWHSAPQRR